MCATYLYNIQMHDFSKQLHVWGPMSYLYNIMYIRNRKFLTIIKSGSWTLKVERQLHFF